MVDRRLFLQALTSMTALTVPYRCLAAQQTGGTKGKVIERKSKPTLTPFGLNHRETMRLLRRGGEAWELTLLDTSAEIVQQTAEKITAYAFDCNVEVNGKPLHLRREVGTQASFYEPWQFDGVHLWFDGASCIFKEDGGFMEEKDWRGGLICRPNHKARFVVQEAEWPICPEPLQLWYPNDTGRLDIRECYNGDDCWMGPYQGKAAHCGLDINMKAGTVLSAPISLDDQYLFNSTAAGFNNNRWRGVRRWPDGSQWWLQSHHQIAMLVPERTPLKGGTAYATTAGVYVGSHEHTHFVFRVLDQGGDYLLDPWILFWEMFRQRRAGP